MTHHRIETVPFDGALDLCGGALRPDRTRPGRGLGFKPCDAEQSRTV